MYESLSHTDLYRRFFTVYRPGPKVLQKWIDRIPDRGRRLIVRRETGAVVADGGYVRSEDGDAELDLVVVPEARGWLGGYLLDRLVTAARADGVRNLRADVLVENGPMLGLIHHRRYVNAGHDDHTVAHVLIAVGAETPQWTEAHDRPRILIEGGGLGWIPDGLSRSLGVDVLQCPGPAATGRRCPALQGRTCPLAAEADAVVCALDPHGQRDEVLGAHHRLHGRTRLFVTADAGDAAEHLTGDRPALEAVARALGLPTALPRRPTP
jgi:hypothetical protein